jgi:hypothetical protein
MSNKILIRDEKGNTMKTFIILLFLLIACSDSSSNDNKVAPVYHDITVNMYSDTKFGLWVHTEKDTFDNFTLYDRGSHNFNYDSVTYEGIRIRFATYFVSEDVAEFYDTYALIKVDNDTVFNDTIRFERDHSPYLEYIYDPKHIIIKQQ